MPEKRCAKRDPVSQPLQTEYRFIPLTRHKIAIVDAEDFERLEHFSWRADPDGFGNFRASTSVRKPKRTTVMMHRFILGLKPGDPEVDHWNRNPLDNRKQNLRKATSSQNKWNTGARRTNKSGFKGVWLDDRGKWQSMIAISGKVKWLGRFPSPEQAARAYDVAAKKYHGEFAVFNFPPI